MSQWLYYDIPKHVLKIKRWCYFFIPGPMGGVWYCEMGIDHSMWRENKPLEEGESRLEPVSNYSTTLRVLYSAFFSEYRLRLCDVYFIYSKVTRLGCHIETFDLDAF